VVSEFHWVLPGQLAGSARPGLFDPLAVDLAGLRDLGVRHIVTLTEAPLPPIDHLLGFQITHFPIDDMGIPTPRRAARLCDVILTSIVEDAPVLVHCKAGLGRTGTILAASLICLGRTAEAARGEVRRICPRYIQSLSQELFLDHFAQYLAAKSEHREPAVMFTHGSKRP
jgi:atypical dual specificity phosphatase